MRIGHGIDFHRLVKDRKLILGGIDIPYDYGLDGHSDADVLVHAICDALLGAAAKRDIGYHFSDKDPQYKNISSLILLKKCIEIILPLEIVNIDATVIAQKPKLLPYIEKMEYCIAETIGTDVSNINIKATTTEGMGYCGSGEGIEAHAVCLLKRKED
ncbi:MAG: 2-C-methyl-D-erythritol 2,4-cyclodiphosphate synthase [Clostridia bacterium]|nr:2-C-methyl-D-erythritol 2,4-cyclodiphosphate synthase [Clostridia bacterium]